MTEEEKAIEAIKDDLEWHKKELKPIYREYLNMAISALEEQEKHRWIPVSERLPDVKPSPFETYSFLTQSKGGFIQILEYADGWNCVRLFNGSIDREREITDIIAWKPLPEQYKEGVKNGKID